MPARRGYGSMRGRALFLIRSALGVIALGIAGYTALRPI